MARGGTLSIMNQFSDQSLAKHLLEAREHGITFRRYFGKNIAAYFFILFVSLAIYYGWPKYCEVCQVAHGGSWLLVGFASGMLLCFCFFTMVTLRALKKGLPFRLKVTDWDKVQKLANGEDVG
jgi:hypothetical protein